MKREKHKHIIGGALIIAGTAIGAGMLALPVSTAAGGFLPALFIYLLCWVFMTVTGLYLLELTLKMEKGSNLISIADHYLGRTGRVFAWLLYLFLFYSLSVAYVSLGGDLLARFFDISSWAASMIFVLLLSGAVYYGAIMVDRMNMVLMAGLIGAYFLFLFSGFPYIEPERLTRMNFPAIFSALPVVFTSFAYQGTIPSLVEYMRRDKRALQLAIIVGSSLVFLIYLLFEILILGTIPLEGEYGLLAALKSGKEATYYLRYHAYAESIYQIAGLFSLFAVMTSFLGVNLGLFDFLADGLKIRKKGVNKLLIWAITFLPPAFVAITTPNLFFTALGLAGSIGCALLLGFLPTLMIWVSRYRLGEKRECSLALAPRWFLTLLFAFILFELLVEFFLKA